MSAGYGEIGGRARTIRASGRSRTNAGSAALMTMAVLLVAALSGGLLWLVWIYGNGLRDPRYLDGWVLAAGMALQLYFHIATRKAWLSPKAAARWRRLHILAGFLLIAAFVSHIGLSLPDTGFEWALGSGFMLVALSGGFGVHLAWSRRAKGGLDDRGAGAETIATRRAELARDVHAAATSANPAAAMIALPAPPYDAWIADLYTSHLRDFLQGPRNLAAHLVGSQRPLLRLTEEIDSLSRHVDAWSQEKLARIKALVIDKDRLDRALVHHRLEEGWLRVHVPVTYALVVLTVLHILVVYAFSSRSW